MGEFLEGGAAQLTVQEKRHPRLGPVAACDLAVQQRLKGRAQDRQLIDQMADLQALIIVLRPWPAAPCILVLQRVALMLLAVEARLFDLPAQAPGAAEHGDGGRGHRQIGHVDEAAAGGLAALAGGKRLNAFQPLESMAVIVEVG